MRIDDIGMHVYRVLSEYYWLSDDDIRGFYNLDADDARALRYMIEEADRIDGSRRQLMGPDGATYDTAGQPWHGRPDAPGDTSAALDAYDVPNSPAPAGADLWQHEADRRRLEMQRQDELTRGAVAAMGRTPSDALEEHARLIATEQGLDFDGLDPERDGAKIREIYTRASRARGYRGAGADELDEY